MTTITTMTTMAATPSPSSMSLSTAHCCPQCGYDTGLPAPEEMQAAFLNAQNQISDLQAQVRLLNQKASSAVDRWADYEDELAKLRAELDAARSQPQVFSPTSTAPTVSTPSATSPIRSSFLSTGAASRLSALLSPRKSTPNLKAKPLPATPPPPPRSVTRPGSGMASAPFSPGVPVPGSPSPSTDDLIEALTREQALRLEAEGRLSETSREVEELSVSLFEQANEMVATERRARAKLEERVETLEKRDAGKRRRLERLEGAMERIERVRSLLGQPDQSNVTVTAPVEDVAADGARKGEELEATVSPVDSPKLPVYPGHHSGAI